MRNLPYKLKHAIQTVYNDFGDTISVEKKLKILRKHGRNDALGTTQQLVWAQGGMEVDAVGNTIDTISSSNASDTQEVVIEGHTVDGNGDKTFVVQNATLDGQNKVTLSTPLNILSRMYNNDSSEFAGDVYGYEDDTVTAGVPQTPNKIHAKIPIGDNQTLKAAASIQSTDYWLITDAIFSVDKQNSRAVDFRVQIRLKDKIFRTVVPPIAVHSNGGSVQIFFEQVIIVPANADIRVLAVSSGADTGVSAGINGYLATKS